MTTVVQNIAVTNSNAATSIVFTLASTGAGNLVVVTGALFGTYTGVTITNNGTAGTWATAVFKAANSRFVFVARCLAIPSGVTQVTATFTGGSGGVFGAAACQEVNGSGTWSNDQTGNGGFASNTVTVTAGGVDTGTTDFVAGGATTGNGSNPSGISNPPSTYTSAAYQPDDFNFASGECCYRINSSAVTDAATWNCSNITPGDPAALASFQLTTGAITLTAASGSFSLAGQTAALQSGALALASGSFGFSGQSVTLAQTGATAFTLLANPGTFDLTGASSTTDLATETTGGSFGFTGQAASFSQGSSGSQTLIANAGSFSLAGQSLSFITGIPLTPIVCSGGSFDSLTPMPGLML